MDPNFYWIAVALVIVTSSARLTRLATVDKFPPAVWFRDKFADLTDGGPRRRGWQLLMFCGYCFSFWATLAVMVTADLSGVLDGKPVADWMTPAWWIANGTLGGSYLAAILMAHDGDNDDSAADDEDEN